MLIPVKDSLPLFVTPGRCRAVVKPEFVDDGLRMACDANYPRHSIQPRPSGPKWMPVFLLQLTVPPQNHRPTLPRTETLIFPSYSVVEPLFVRAMMRLKFDCCYPVNSTTGSQKSHANVFTRCRKPNCFMPPDAMKRKKRTRACVLVVSPKNVVAGFSGQSPIRICAASSDCIPQTCPHLATYHPIARATQPTPNQRCTSPRSRPSPVTRHPSLSPLVARCLDQSRTSCLIQKSAQ